MPKKWMMRVDSMSEIALWTSSGRSISIVWFSALRCVESSLRQTSLVLDLPAAFLVMVLLVGPPLCKGRLYRWQGVTLLGIYAAYCAVQFML